MEISNHGATMARIFEEEMYENASLRGLRCEASLNTR